MSAIDRLMQGSIDIHVHFGPDPRVERRADALDTVRAARDLGMRALVLKSHDYPTQPVAYHVGKLVPEVQVLGSVALDFEVGGLNPHAVEASAKMGAKMVYMPTWSADADRRRTRQRPAWSAQAARAASHASEPGIAILDANERLVPQVGPILEVVKRYDLVLATGHLSPRESIALVREARAMGINRTVVTHANLIQKWMGFEAEELQALVQMGAYVEFTFNALMPTNVRQAPEDLVAMVRAVGPEHSILATDFGQAHHPIPPEGFRMGIATMLMSGLDETDVGLMVKDNPARLLGL